jgi:hypothetical protein
LRIIGNIFHACGISGLCFAGIPNSVEAGYTAEIDVQYELQINESFLNVAVLNQEVGSSPGRGLRLSQNNVGRC